MISRSTSCSVQFQSTPPARGATVTDAVNNINLDGISIHAPREGGDPCPLAILVCTETFQSTPPARGATKRLTIGSCCLAFQSTPPARGAT